MSKYYPISGYGITNLEDIIDESKIMETGCKEHGSFPDYHKIEDLIAYISYGEDIGYVFGVPLQLPYGENIFKTKEEINAHLYNAIEDYLKDGITEKDLVIDEYYDYETN